MMVSLRLCWLSTCGRETPRARRLHRKQRQIRQARAAVASTELAVAMHIQCVLRQHAHAHTDLATRGYPVCRVVDFAVRLVFRLQLGSRLLKGSHNILCRRDALHTQPGKAHCLRALKRPEAARAPLSRVAATCTPP